MKIDALESSIADHQPLPDKICEFIREAIIVGKMKPGEKISEAKLAEDLHISRTPIREAIRMLESEGFVSIIPRRGAIVSEFTTHDLYEMYQVKACLDAFAASLVAVSISERELARMRRLNQEEQAAVEQQDFARYVKIHEEFHQVFIGKSGNDKLDHLNLTMMNHIQRLQSFFTDKPEIFRSCSATHGELIAAFEARDPHLVRTIVERNIMHIAEQIRLYGEQQVTGH
jgi:DNA-binding GntR family transcriptional regulator